MQQNGNECRSGYPLMMKSEGKKRRRLLSRTSQNSQRNLFMEVVFLLQIFSSWFILEYPNLKSGVEPAYWYQNRLFYGCDTLLAFNKLLLGLTLKQNTPCLLLTLKPQSLWNNLTKYKAQNYNSLSPPPNSGSKLEAIILVNQAYLLCDTTEVQVDPPLFKVIRVNVPAKEKHIPFKQVLLKCDKTVRISCLNDS